VWSQPLHFWYCNSMGDLTFSTIEMP